MLKPLLSLQALNPTHLLKRNFQLVRRGKLIYLRRMRTIISPQPLTEIQAELNYAQSLGLTRDGKQMYLYRTAQQTPLLLELGRLREIAFRAVGEGSGTACDTDQYDYYYDHLILWDPLQQEIVGAYRMLRTGEHIQTGHPLCSLYTASLFDYQPAMQDLIPQGLELGRSFVQPKYWGNYSLDYLWQGIGAYLRYYPHLRYLFGPVSISDQLPPRAKALLVNFYRKHFQWSGPSLVKARTPYKMKEKYRHIADTFGQRPYADELPVLKQRLRNMKVNIPTLYKQYGEACEAGGVSFCDFNIDKSFGNCLDAFIMLDIERMRPLKRKRYLGDLGFAQH